jgi:hypothetical protein
MDGDANYAGERERTMPDVMNWKELFLSLRLGRFNGCVVTACQVKQYV